MSQNAPLILRIVASSICIAKRAGKIVRDVREEGNLEIIEKGVNDFCTKADRGSQHCILTSLTKQFPNTTIIGEEDDEHTDSIPADWIINETDESILKYECPKELQSVTEEQVTIWVDPLDGTSEYTQGFLDNVTVLIGISVDDRAVAGIIHQPYYGYDMSSGYMGEGRTIWGVVGLGTGDYKATPPPEDRRVVVTTRSHNSAIVQSALDNIAADEVIRVGGLGNKVLLLLEGKANAYVYASGGSKKWDTCAPEAVLEAAGGFLTDIHGKHYSYHKSVQHENKLGILATALKNEHEYYFSRIPDSVKNNFLS